MLSDHARAAKRQKRGGAWAAVTLDAASEQGAFDADTLVLTESLDELATLNERRARVVEMRVFGGMTVAEVAEELGVSGATIELEWRTARAWLWRRLS